MATPLSEHDRDARLPLRADNSWQCQDGRDRYVEGHIPALDSDGMLKPPSRDFDSWCHVGPPGTHVARVLINPWSGLLQGAEEYLRHTVGRSGLAPEVVCRLQRVLDVWDAHH
ncbi:hypothetical protein ACFYY8_18580 [Streptosporangium sp. NPDC001559]|uniref:hypothetical protein n=1 Tax=Streptosporangium sp. NPDC001559 TaxID=3366187 RepID=UPI0036E55794